MSARSRMQIRNEKTVATVVIPVKNEAKNLSVCLSSLSLNYTVLVVDSNSTDETAEIARKFGAEVVQFHWRGGFPKKRNWILQNYNFVTDWVLFLDADERLTPSFEAALLESMKRNDIAGYWLRYSNFFLGRRLKYGIPQKKLALFRVGAGLYEKIEDSMWSEMDMEIHEHPILTGRVAIIRQEILHDDFKGIHHYIAKHNAYSTWEANRYMGLRGEADRARKFTFRQKVKYYIIDKPWFSLLYFLAEYIFYLGFLDGMHGFSKAVLKANYFYQVYLKISELKR